MNLVVNNHNVFLIVFVTFLVSVLFDKPKFSILKISPLLHL